MPADDAGGLPHSRNLLSRSSSHNPLLAYLLVECSGRRHHLANLKCRYHPGDDSCFMVGGAGATATEKRMRPCSCCSWSLVRGCWGPSWCQGE